MKKTQIAFHKNLPAPRAPFHEGSPTLKSQKATKRSGSLAKNISEKLKSKSTSSKTKLVKGSPSPVERGLKERSQPKLTKRNGSKRGS